MAGYFPRLLPRPVVTSRTRTIERRQPEETRVREISRKGIGETRGRGREKVIDASSLDQNP